MSKIIAVRTKDFRNLDGEQLICFSPDVTSITGKNSAGKTNVLLSILETLKTSKDITKYVAEGKEEAETEVTIGEGGKNKIIVTAKYQPGKPKKLTLKTGGGVPVDSTLDGVVKTKQSILDALWPDCTIDLEDIKRRSENDLVKFILQHTGVEEEYNKLEDEYQDAYSKRRVARQVMDSAEGKVGSEPPNNVVPVNVQKLRDQLNSLQMKKDNYQEAYNELLIASTKVDNLKKLLQEAENELDKIALKIADMEDVTEDYNRVLTDFQNAEEINAVARKHEEWLINKREAEQKRSEWQALEDKVKEFPDKRAKLLADAGIEGLTTTEDGIQINGIPVKELAENEKLKLLINLKISEISKLNNRLTLPDNTVIDTVKTLVIENGRALDHDSRLWVYEKAKTAGVQTIIERVTQERWDADNQEWVEDYASDKAESYTVILIDGQVLED